MTVHWPRRDSKRSLIVIELEALADPKVQEEFLAHSATLLSHHSLPLYLQIKLFSFRRNLSEETSAFLQAQHELKMVSDLSASLTRKKFVFDTIASKYANEKGLFLAADLKVAKLNAKIEMASEAKIKWLDDCLAIALAERAGFEEDLNNIEAVITTIKDGFVRDLEKLSNMEGMTHAATLLVARRKSAWNSLRTTIKIAQARELTCSTNP